MDYIIVSTAVIDNIYDPKGRHLGKKLGGAGIYAYNGVRVWTDNVLLVTGVGKDFSVIFESWIKQNNMNTSGLIIKDAKTPISNISYSSSESRQEIPEYGIEHYKKMEATPFEIASKIDNTKGIYIFKDCEKSYWEKIFEFKKYKNFKIMWELNADVCIPECLEAVKKIAKNCEMISLNKNEAFSLFGCNEINYVKHELAKWNIPLIYLRTGSKGAILISRDNQIDIPSVRNIDVVDTTGAGNSSTAAVMVGYCENLDIFDIGFMGSISASFIIRQFGPVEINDTVQKEAQMMLKKKKNI